MGLTDPTSGAGYSFGQKFPSAHATSIVTQLPSALKRDGTDAITGSITVNNGAEVIIAGGSGLQIGAAGSMALATTAGLTLGGYQNIKHLIAVESGATGPFSVPAACTILRYTGTPGTSTEDLVLPVEANSFGMIITITRTNTANTVRIRDSANAVSIASFTGGGTSAVTVACDGSSWRCVSWSGNATGLVV
jgi:hypothetical protein